MFPLYCKMLHRCAGIQCGGLQDAFLYPRPCFWASCNSVWHCSSRFSIQEVNILRCYNCKPDLMFLKGKLLCTEAFPGGAKVQTA